MKCPHCSANLIEDSLHGILFNHCGHCRALWFDAGRLASYRRRAGLRENSTEYYWEFSEQKDADPSFTCPRCKSPTLKKGTFQGLEMYRCTQCFGFSVTQGKLSEILKSDCRFKSYLSNPEDQISGVELLVQIVEGFLLFISAR